MQGAAGAQVEAVEVVQRHIQQRGQARAGHADTLVAVHGLQVGLQLPIAVAELLTQGRVAQFAVDQAAAGQQADMAVGKGGQIMPALGQVVGGAALGDQ